MIKVIANINIVGKYQWAIELLKSLADAPIVLNKKFVSVTHWLEFFLILLLSGTQLKTTLNRRKFRFLVILRCGGSVIKVIVNTLTNGKLLFLTGLANDDMVAPIVPNTNFVLVIH